MEVILWANVYAQDVIIIATELAEAIYVYAVQMLSVKNVNNMEKQRKHKHQWTAVGNDTYCKLCPHKKWRKDVHKTN